MPLVFAKAPKLGQVVIVPGNLSGLSELVALVTDRLRASQRALVSGPTS